MPGFERTRPRPRPAIAPSDGNQGNAGSSVQKTRHVTMAARQRLSELAKARHAAGGFVASGNGGKRKSKKPSKARVAQLVADAAREKKTAQQIIDVFKDGISPNQPITIRLKAAEAWIGIEHKEGTLGLKEEATQSEAMDRETALAFLAERLTSGHAASVLRNHMKQLEQVTIPDAEVVEDDYGIAS
jgi:hypothetical protein